MRRINRITAASLLALITLAAACSRTKSAPPIDDALKNDLALASQAQPYNPQQTVSPNEAGYASQTAPRSLTTVARRPAAAPARRTTPVYRRPAGTAAPSSSNGGYYPATQPQPTVEKNTVRDATIGAVAGAVIGATTSRKKVQGGLIGAAIGGLLGGVVGNNVDVKRKY